MMRGAGRTKRFFSTFSRNRHRVSGMREYSQKSAEQRTGSGARNYSQQTPVRRQRVNNHAKRFLYTTPLVLMSQAPESYLEERPIMMNSQFFQKRFKVPEQEDFVRRVDHEEEIENPGINNIQVRIPGGNLILHASDDDKISYKVQWKENGHAEEMPKLSVRGDTAYLELDGFAAFQGQKNAYIMEITLPKHVNMDIGMYAGTIFIDEMEGNLNANIYVGGTIYGNCYARDANLSVKAGDIKLHHLRGNLVATAWAGDIKVLFDDISAENSVNLTCYMGDIKARFPNGFMDTNSVYKKAGQVPNHLNADVSTTNYLGGVKIDTLVPEQIEDHTITSKY